MNSKAFTFLLLLLLVLSISTPGIKAEGDQKGKSSKNLNKIQGTPIRALLNINNVSTVIKNDGITDIDRDEQNSGFIYPKGSGKTAVFESGLLWGVRLESLSENFQLIIKINRLGKQKTKVYPDEI